MSVCDTLPPVRSIEERNALIEANLDLVRWIVSHRFGWALIQGHGFDDLVGAGSMGLLRACELYDPDRGKFATYAAHWIRQAVRRHLHEDRLIHVPEDVESDIRVVRLPPSIDLDDYSRSHPSALDEVLARESDERFELLLTRGSLTERHRHILRRRFHDGASHADINAEMGVTGLHTTTCTALRRLRKSMEEKDR